MNAPTTRLPLASLRLDGGTQIRAGLTDATVAEYQAALDAGAAFPPVVVFFDGEAHWLADGFHRVAAHEAAGVADVLAEVRAGTKRDALLFAVGANGHHGLPRTNADKRRAVTVLLADEEWSKWSAREIARRALVSHDLAARLKAEHESLSSDDSDGAAYTTKHGTVATMDTANIGKTPRAPKARDHQTPIVSDATIKAASLDNVLAAQIEAMTLATVDAAYTALTHALANEEIGQDKAKALRAQWTERHRALVAAKDEPAPVPPPAPPSSGQVALELDAPATPEAPDAPEADMDATNRRLLHQLTAALAGARSVAQARARQSLNAVLADLLANQADP